MFKIIYFSGMFIWCVVYIVFYRAALKYNFCETVAGACLSSLGWPICFIILLAYRVIDMIQSTYGSNDGKRR
jgi:hypothetical protein